MPLTAQRPTLPGALATALALLLGLAPPGAAGLGLGRPLVHSTLGNPLDVSIPLTLADGEQLTDACLRAEVSAGDARVPAGLLQLRIEGEPGQQRVRLQSLARIDEPTLRITLALGCPLRLTREFNAFIDPPANVAAEPPPPAPPPAPLAAAPLMPAELASRPPAEPSPTLAAPPVAKPRPRASPRPAGPRLVLDRPEVLVAEAPRPVAPPASAPRTELTPELEAQIAQLEQTVAQLRAELQARQLAEAAAASAPQPAAPPPVAAPVAMAGARAPAYRSPMTWLLTLGLSLLAGAAAFHASRWRDQRMRRERAYWQALHAAEGAAAPMPMTPLQPGMAPPVTGGAAALPDEGQHQITSPQPRPMPWAPAHISAPGAAAVQRSMQATQPLPAQVEAAPVLSNELTVVDELLDLEQQVDFLQLLGQQDAAADLLSARLARGHAGAMPYLLLLELCQQRGEPEVFADLAKQFEQRFQALAPQWAQSLTRGRSLDASPSVIAHLQVIWSDPGAAMQMLRELLARGGGPGTPHFDLPAYRDLLMLYSVARDLFEGGLRSDGVDLMLPLD